MAKNNEKPISQAFYDAHASAYAAGIDVNPSNAYYERPAMQSLLPKLKGKKVLDAGCGPGIYSEWLTARGAEVLGLDASAEMVHQAQKRLGNAAEIRQADLGQPLDFLADKSIDLVLSSLVLDHLEDWGPLFKEFSRILRSGGYLLFSILHPVHEYTRPNSKNYFATERLESNWAAAEDPSLKMQYFRRPLQTVFTPLLAANFQIDSILEPTPTEAYKQREPNEYEELLKRPGILCIRASKT